MEVQITMVDLEKVQQAVTMLLEAIGEDPEREGLADTPKRVANMYAETMSGYEEDPKEDLSKVFKAENTDVVLEKEISFFSTCEHHLLPFFGKVHIAYIPDDKVVGLSKLGRLVDVYAKRLQLQEKMTAQIADSIMKELQPLGVMIMVEAEHTCMTMRGIKKVGSKTVSMATRGQFKENLHMQKIIQDMVYSK